MGDKEQDPYEYIINDCRYSCSQEELLTQVPFAREGEIISPEMENSKVSGRKLECTDETKSRHGIESRPVDTDSANLGFGGERKLEGNSEEKEERVKRQVSPLVNCSGEKAKEEEEKDEVVVNDVIDADEAEQESESESEKKKSQKKRELPRSMFELLGWDEFPTVGAQRDIKAARIVEKRIGNVASSSISSVRKASVDPKGDGKSKAIADNNVGGSSSVKKASVEGKGYGKSKGSVESSGVRNASVNGKSKGKGGGDETNKCILDALRLLVTHNTAHHDGKVDIFDTAMRCGMVFPTSRFLSELQPDD